MKLNESLSMSMRVKETLRADLSHTFAEDIPVSLIENKFLELKGESKKGSRERVFTPVNVMLIMLLSAIEEDKSMQQGLNIFKAVFDRRCMEAQQAEAEMLNEERVNDEQSPKKAGRPKQYKSRLPKSYQQPLSDNTAAYAVARKKLDTEIVRTVYEHCADFGELEKESWYGMETVITDGTYLQLQDTEDIRSEYTVKGQENSYPQALLQVMIRQGTGQVSQCAVTSRHESELQIVIPMIKKLEKNKLLLADDLYNAYYHFCLVLNQGCHMIVPGKRDRNYTVIRSISENDQIVKISKTDRPDYVSKEEWKNLPRTLLLRRITYTYPTKNGMEDAVLYTTVLNENIPSADIVAKYTMRWDIEISIREVKTIMDINVLRSKSTDMLYKELLISLTAYNLVRKIIAKSADPGGFSPQKDLFHECASFDRHVFLDKRGRVFFKRSPGRYGYTTNETNQTPSYSASKRKEKALYSRYKTWQVQKI